LGEKCLFREIGAAPEEAIVVLIDAEDSKCEIM
jgi:hypothetical protein